MSALVLHDRPAAQVRRPPRVEPGRGVLGERWRRREQREHGGQHQFIGHNASSLRLRSNAGSKHVVNADRCLQAGEIDFIYIIARKIPISRGRVRPEIAGFAADIHPTPHFHINAAKDVAAWPPAVRTQGVREYFHVRGVDVDEITELEKLVFHETGAGADVWRHGGGYPRAAADLAST